MKMRTLIKRAYQIISAESEHVYDEFREDDGTITAQNHRAAIELQGTYDEWMESAEKTIGSEIHKIPPLRLKSAAPRGVTAKKPRKIVVVQ